MSTSLHHLSDNFKIYDVDIIIPISIGIENISDLISSFRFRKGKFSQLSFAGKEKIFFIP